MGAVLLSALYLATSLGLAALVRVLHRRPSLPAAAIVTLLPLVFTAGGFLPGRVLAPTTTLTHVAPWLGPDLAARAAEVSQRINPLLNDPLAEMLPWQRAGRDHFLLNPSQGGGAALFANGQSALLYPTQLLARWLPPVRGATYMQAARLLVAAWGMFLLLRFLALSELAALLGAAIFLGGGFVELWRLHPQALVAATVPWILYAAIRLVRRPGAAAALALGTAGAVAVYAGHPETLFQAMLFVLPVAGCLLVGCFSARRLAAVVGWGAAAGALAFLLSAPLLLPFLDNLSVSVEWQRRRAGLRDSIEVPATEAVARLAPSLTPLAFGDPLSDAWSGPENVVELAGGSVGVAALLLVPAAFALGRRRKWLAVWLGLGVTGLLVAAHMPWISRPFGEMPLLEESLLKRLTLWWALAAPVLAAHGIEALRRGRGRRTTVVAAAVGAVLLALLGWSLPASLLPAGVPMEALALGLGLLAALELRRAAAVALLAAALLVPRAVLFSRWVPVASAYTFYPETAAVRLVEERLAPERREGFRVSGLDAALLAHSAAFFDLGEVRAYDPMTFAPYDRFLSSVGSPRRYPGRRLVDPAAPGLAFLGVRYVFDHPSMGHRPGVDVVYAGSDALVYENPAALPRAFVPGSAEVVPQIDGALRAAAAIGDFSQRVVVTGVTLPPGVYPNGHARLSGLRVETGRIRVTARAEEAALVATSQPAIPGWRLYRDGEEMAPVRVNGAFLGAVVPAGESRLEWLYRPRSFLLGLLLAGAGLIGGLGLASLGRAARRQRGRAPRRAREAPP